MKGGNNLSPSLYLRAILQQSVQREEFQRARVTEKDINVMIVTPPQKKKYPARVLHGEHSKVIPFNTPLNYSVSPQVKRQSHKRASSKIIK